MDDFWTRTLYLLNQKNYTQVKLSNYIGRPKSTVATWNRKKLIPPGDICLKIADLLDVDLNYLVSGEISSNIIDPNRKRLDAIIDKLPDARIIDLIRLAEGWLPTEEAGKLQA